MAANDQSLTSRRETSRQVAQSEGTCGSQLDTGDSLSAIFGLNARGHEEDALLGAEIGGVKIIRLIAQGGMGRVYEGLQQKPSRAVAVKVMRPGLAPPTMMRRFEYEVEVLARLRHPGIAQIFAAGVHHVAGTPVPYFIMEYIRDAKPITAYAADAKLPARARIELFRRVCDAVAHGHQQGIVHRDLKPGNILVDAHGNPKVIDFGIAKATDSDLAITTMQTDIGQLVGTLHYMGPEQLVGDPQAIDVRSDVYALGVVLYELLAGRLPHDLRLKSLFEAQHIVNGQRPTPLSTLDRSLDREVTAINAKCLEKDPSRRYSSAGELAGDLERYLHGLPVIARPESGWETVQRLCKRHGVWVAAGGVAMASLLVALAVVAYSYRVAVRERESADEKRREVARAYGELEQRRQDSEVVVEFLGDAMQLPSPSTNSGEATFHQWLHAAAEAVKSRFANADSPRDLATRGRLLTKIGATLCGLGYPGEGRRLLMEADDALRAVTATQPLLRAQCLSELSLASWECGDYPAAARAGEEAHRVTAAAQSPEDPAATMMLHSLAIARMGQGLLAEADRLFADIYAAVSAELGPADARAGIVLSNWGETLRRLGRLADAETKLGNAVEILEAAGVRFELALAGALNNRGEVLRLRGLCEEAIRLHERAKSIQDTHLSPVHYGRSASLSKLGEAHRDLGDLVLAESLFLHALSLRERAGLGSHPETAVILVRLARTAAAQEKPAEAVRWYGRCMEVLGGATGVDHADARAVDQEFRAFKATLQSSESAVAERSPSPGPMP
jgi:eukaryotic-like serine/threonine-protein kinase